MNYFIITGASKGFGYAVAIELLHGKNNFVIAIARTDPKFPTDRHTFYNCDLSDVAQTSELAERLFNNIPATPEAVYLINNAATVLPIGPIGRSESADLVGNFNLNAIAPMLFSRAMLKQFASQPMEKGIVNISSGASKTPYHGWSGYCSSKAAIEMLTETMKLEYPNFAISSYDPGVMDTLMQDEIRSQSEENFHSLTKFIMLKNDDKLQTPAAAAKKFVTRYFSKFVPQVA